MQKKHTKYLIAVLILILLAVNVFASGFSLNVVSPVPVKIYKVGQLDDKTIIYDEKFKEYDVDSEMSEDSTQISNALYGYILRDNIPVDNEGLNFSLEKGLYLLMNEPKIKDDKKYTLIPTLVYVDKDTSVEMKYEFDSIEQPDEPEEEAEENPKEGPKEDIKKEAEKSQTATPKKEPKNNPEQINKTNKKTTESNNYMTVSCKKEWLGKTGKEITVQLIKNSKVISEKKLNRFNGFNYKWKNLKKSAYTVVEKKVPEGFTTKTERNGAEFTIKNTSKEKPGPIINAVKKINKIIRTSDPAYLMLVFTLFVISGSILIARRPAERRKNR